MTQISYTLGDVRKILRKAKPSHLRIVTSENLISKLGWAFREIGVSRKDVITVPNGEKAKEWRVLEKLLKDFSQAGLDRNSIVIIVGGGTVGDLAGFAASIYLRGIRYIQIPTTLVAQVDSAYGGKTGINFLGSKNQIGSLHRPIATIADIRFLKFLSEGQIIDGLGEIIKCGLIHDPSILSLLKKETVAALSRSSNLKKIVEKAVAVKKFYTDADFRDIGTRGLLNFGHTYGHSIELKYRVSHGYAVIIGMIHELAFAESIGITPASVRLNLIKLLASLGITIDTQYKPDKKLMVHDKKVIGDSIMLPVVTKEGKSAIKKVAIEKMKNYITKL